MKKKRKGKGKKKDWISSKEFADLVGVSEHAAIMIMRHSQEGKAKTTGIFTPNTPQQEQVLDDYFVNWDGQYYAHQALKHYNNVEVLGIDEITVSVKDTNGNFICNAQHESQILMDEELELFSVKDAHTYHFGIAYVGEQSFIHNPINNTKISIEFGLTKVLCSQEVMRTKKFDCVYQDLDYSFAIWVRELIGWNK